MNQMDPNKSAKTFQRLVTERLQQAVSKENEDDSSTTMDNTSYEESIPTSAKLDNESDNDEEKSTTTARRVYIGDEQIDIDDDCSDESESTTTSSSVWEDFSDKFDVNSDSDDDGIGAFDGQTSSMNSANYDWVAEMEDSLENKIARLAIKHRLTHVAVNDFLQLFQDLGHDVHKDARTILGTTRDVSDTNFEHFGLVRGLVKKIRSGIGCNIHKLYLQINIDGIPLYNSSGTQFWPILGRIVNGEDSRPFVISVFCGSSKPPDLAAFLDPFLKEMKKLEQRSLTVDGRSFHVVLKSVVCDAPARSFVKMIKAHTGKFGCERCVQRGHKIGGPFTFPDMNATPRNNATFRRQTNKPHHLGFSPFTDLDIDMIHGFPLDYMHLVCLGVVKRLLLLWRGEKNCPRKSAAKRRKSRKDDKKGKDKQHQLTTADIANINNRIEVASQHFPKEFQRKGRSFDELEHWKAVEFRTFLLYSGPAVLKGILDEKKYQHFLLLHVAIRVLCTPNVTTKQIDYAESCLKSFVKMFGKIYGDYQIVYNVHSLLHLANECRFHGALDSFSAFPFESYLGQLKRILRGTRRPLSQLKKRLSEIDRHGSFSNPSPIYTACTSLQAINVNSPCDSFIMIKKCKILKVKSMSEKTLSGVRYFQIPQQQHNINFYDKPFESSLLQIYMADSRLINEKQIFNVSLSDDYKNEDFVKCVSIPDFNNNFVFFPILHQL